MIGIAGAGALLLIAIIASAAGSDSSGGGKRGKPAVTADEREAAVKKWTAQLEDGKTCPDRRAAIAELDKLGDKKAIPALEKARARKGDGDDGNGCLVRDAEQALDKLRKQP